jgi:hypothetical protein
VQSTGRLALLSSSCRYESLSIEFEDVIVGHFAGHTHKDEKRVVFDSQGNAASVM